MAKGTTIRMWRRSIVVLVILLGIGFGAVIFNLVRIQLVDGEVLHSKAVDNQMRDTPIAAQRGTVYDANMKVLATSADVYKVIVAPAYFSNDAEGEAMKQALAKGLSPLLDMSEEDILKACNRTNAKGSKLAYYQLKGKVENDIKDAILKFKQENGIGRELYFETDYKRYYPYGTLASDVLGFTGSDGQGLNGIELEYNNELTGTPGRLVTAKNARGTDMPFQYEQKIPAKNGNSLVLTINETVQRILEKNVREAAEACQVRNRACGIVMEVNTGAILGMAVTGDFDPNEPFTVYDKTQAAAIEAMPEGDERTEALKIARELQWRNKCVSDTYNPGSVFKMVTSSAGIEEGVITENTHFSCGGYYTVADRRIGCWRTQGHGGETFAQGLSNSCNPVFMQVAEKLGSETFYKYFEAFGMTKLTGIDLPGEAGSFYYSAKNLGPTELATSSFGQSFRITPMQMIVGAAAVANGGYIVQPHIVSQVIDAEGNIVETTDTTAKRQVISEETSRRVNAMLEATATTGTAKNGYIAGYRVAGKTGTSEKIQEWIEAKKTDPNAEKRYIASYCGYAPADSPKYIMLTFFDEPVPQGGQVFGSAIAGPPFASTMAEILPYLGVEKKYSEEELKKLDVKTPEVTGLKKSEAQNKVNAANLSYKFYGEGDTVVSQVPEAGKSIPKNGTVVLFLDSASTTQTVTVPKLTGLSLSQANVAAANAGINISISGAALTGDKSGKAIADTQDVEPGTKVAPGTVITVHFVDQENVH